MENINNEMLFLTISGQTITEELSWKVEFNGLQLHSHEKLNWSDFNWTHLKSWIEVASTELTREPSKLIHADFVHILSIYRGHHAKKNPKRIWDHVVCFEDYGHFTEFSAYGNGVYIKIEWWNFDLKPCLYVDFMNPSIC